MLRGLRWPLTRVVFFWPCRLCGLHIRQPARVDFGPRRLWCITSLH